MRRREGTMSAYTAPRDVASLLLGLTLILGGCGGQGSGTTASGGGSSGAGGGAGSSSSSGSGGGLPVQGGGSLGPNVIIFDPSMSDTSIQSTLDSVFSKQESNQFGTERYALLFKPG